MGKNGRLPDVAGTVFSELAAKIIAHANDDHPDAVLAVACVQGGAPKATSARLLEITPELLHMEAILPGNDGHRIKLRPPVRTSAG